MKTRVVEFITNLSDGGAENLVKDYCLLIDKSKFDISVVTIRSFTNTAVYKTLKENEIDIIPVYPEWNIFIKIYNKIFGYWHINNRLKKIFKREKAEVIHAHLYTLKYLYRIRRRLRGVRLFYTCHSIPKVYFDERQSYYAKGLHSSNGMRVIALHEDMRAEINALLDIRDTVVVRNGIDLAKFRKAAGCGERTRELLNIPRGSFVVGHVGRFHPVKNHEFLIRIFEKLISERPNAFLLMVGDGEEKERIRNELDRKGLDGRYLILSNRTDVPELMQAMDVFVFPSKYEGLGIVLVEAQASGLRCVVSNAIPEAVLLTDRIVRAGLDEPVEKWCEAILDDNIKGTANGDIEDYDMKREIKKLERLYLSTLSSERGSDAP